MSIIVLTSYYSKEKCYINADMIKYFRKGNPAETIVFLLDQEEFCVEETPDQIVKLIRNESRNMLHHSMQDVQAARRI